MTNKPEICISCGQAVKINSGVEGTNSYESVEARPKRDCDVCGARKVRVEKPTVKTCPMMEIIAKKLFGITSVPKQEQERMVVRACKAASAYHTQELARKEAEIYESFKYIIEENIKEPGLLGRILASLSIDQVIRGKHE